MGYTDEQHQIYVEGIRQGLTPRLAARAARWTVPDVYDWLRQGEDARTDGVASPYRTLLEDVEEAEAACALGCVRTITDSEDWRAAAWILERRFPADYGQVRRLDVEHRGAVEVDVATLIREAVADAGDLEALETRLIAAGADPDVL